MHTRPGDTCETKQDAAAINSRIDTIKNNGKETVYRADCSAKVAETTPVNPGH